MHFLYYSFVLFNVTRLNRGITVCGILGLIVKPGKKNSVNADKRGTSAKKSFGNAILKPLRSVKAPSLGAGEHAGLLRALKNANEASIELMCPHIFVEGFDNNKFHDDLRAEARRILIIAENIQKTLDAPSKKRSIAELEQLNEAGILCRDIAWRIEKDFLLNIEKVRALIPGSFDSGNIVSQKAIREGWKLNVILNNLDRLEVRGRDSAGLSNMALFSSRGAMAGFIRSLKQHGLDDEFKRRLKIADFVNHAMVQYPEGKQPTLVFSHKLAEEIGPLGFNVRRLREGIASDGIFQLALACPDVSISTLSHTRWASNGIINEQNCHPLDNELLSTASGNPRKMKHSICSVLNGDIDNYIELCQRLETKSGKKIAPGITTDAKVISAMIDDYLECGLGLEESFRRAVKDFRGSVAIVMHSSLEPDNLYLAQRGSGQSLYVGVLEEGFVIASETYGLVELTNKFYKLEGEHERVAGNPETRGQIVILDRKKAGTLAGMEVSFYDGSAVKLTEKMLKTSEITTRDINRGEYSHFLLKEISEAPQSMRKTLLGRVSLDSNKVKFMLDETVVPRGIKKKFVAGKYRKIVMLGQGTAAVAGSGIAAIMGDVLEKTDITIESYKATEYCGFRLRDDLSDTLAIAVSQSGTTTDTNRAIDMVKRRGGNVIGIVNRRNSDLVYKADGVLYTSDGRDIEMAVASTKAFYSQIVAGSLLSLYFASLLKALPEDQICSDLVDLRQLPEKIEAIIAEKDIILDAARKFALKKRYWATVGSGPNKVASDEIRIKLSELCYKSIASDFTEDKKHIDLSSEPLIVVCAAGISGPNLSDTLKEVAIFKAHSAFPIVIATQGETQFEEYASSVIYVPPAGERLSFVLSTTVGHLFGYYSAVAIDECAVPVREARASVVRILEKTVKGEYNDYDYEKLAEKLEVPRKKFMELIDKEDLNTGLEVGTAANLAVVFNNLVLGEHMRRDSSSTLNIKPIQSFLNHATRAISELTRPIDAIKHQAKTVTVGISRQEELPAGRVFDAVTRAGIKADQLSFKVINTLEGIASAVKRVVGFTMYRCENFDALGLPDENTTLKVEKKAGIARKLVSRTDKDPRLRGTKRSVVEHGRVFFGMGASDLRSIIIFPVMEKGIRRFVFLVHVDINQKLSLADKIGILKSYNNMYEEIRDAIMEVLPEWNDNLLAKISLKDLLSYAPRTIAKMFKTGKKVSAKK